MENQEYISQIIRYLSGELNEEETQQLLARLAENPELAALYASLEKTWKMAERPAAAPRFNTEAAWHNVKARTIDTGKVVSMPQRRSIPYLKWAAAVAAIAVPAFVLVQMLKTPSAEWASVTTGAEKKTLVLPDSSMVVLNHHTELRYSIDSKKGKRLVELDGEAFFEVSRHADRPFEVKSAHALTQVLGTSFTVHDLKSDTMATLTVESGKVAFGHPGGSGAVILEKGMSARIIRGAAPEKTGTPSPNSQAWRTGRIEFRNTSLKEVAEVLSSYFEVEVKVARGRACQFTGTFEQPTLEEVLEVLSFSMNGSYSKNEGAYVITVQECELPNASHP